MLIFGLDFTSVPRPQKPITYARGMLNDSQLHITQIIPLADFDAWEAFLVEAGPWVAALDFPFGQPAELIANQGWPMRWSEYVAHIATLGLLGWDRTLYDYRNKRLPGDKEHQRRTDRAAKSRSPMKMANPPVGKMFFQGAPRLLRSPGSIMPCRPNADNRILLEGYPALVARYGLAAQGWTNKPSYKNDTKRKQTQTLTDARQAIMDTISSTQLRDRYGIQLDIDKTLKTQCVVDATGDTLDAVLCCIQAAWAWEQRHNNFGVPHDVDPNEGWIVDPTLLL